MSSPVEYFAVSAFDLSRAVQTPKSPVKLINSSPAWPISIVVGDLFADSYKLGRGLSGVEWSKFRIIVDGTSLFDAEVEVPQDEFDHFIVVILHGHAGEVHYGFARDKYAPKCKS